MRRHLVILLATSVLASAYDNRRSAGRSDDTTSVILVVSDGLRWQEVFRGADSSILFGDARVPGVDAETRRKYWRSTVAERRAALMPFVWSTVARDGQLLGNRDRESRVDVTNGLKFSYPGYNEMLVGYPDPRIDNNEFGPNPNVTVLEWLNERDGFKDRVAAFGTWDTFHDIFNTGRSGLDVHTYGSKPNDIVVQQAVLPYLKEKQPRVLFVGYAETDDWGHEGRYDRFLHAAHNVDAFMAQLWSAVQSDPRYRDRTTLIFTADHGRGRTSGDWGQHGEDVPGAEETFIVTIGPEVRARGELRGTSNVVGQVARAVAAAVGLKYRPSACEAASRC